MKLERRNTPEECVEEETQEPKEEKRTEKSAKRKEISVIVYTSILFFVALILILLSYFIQQSKLNEVTEQHGEFSTLAMQNIDALQQENQSLEAELRTTQEELKRAKADLETAQTAQEQMAAEIAGLEQGNEAANLELESTKAELETQRRKTEAISLLASLLSAPEGTDTSSITEQLEALKEYLDGAYLDIYNSYMDSNGKEAQE